MFKAEGESFEQLSAQAAQTTAKPLQLEAGAPVQNPTQPVVEASSQTAVSTPQPEQVQPTAQKSAEAPPKKKDALTAAEKQQLKERATDALQALIKEANRVTTARDYLASLGIIPGQADIKDGERIKAAYRKQVAYFHPDKTTQEVARILGDVGKLFPELADKAHSARLACEEATKTLNNAGSFLSDESRREKYLAQKYGIHASAPDAAENAAAGQQKRSETANQRAEAKTKQRTTTERAGTAARPDWVREAQAANDRSFRDWEHTYASSAWQDFARYWQDRQPPIPKAREVLVEKMKEGRGQIYLRELVEVGVEAFQDVKDLESFKLILEVILKFYDVLKSKYELKQEKRGLPIEIVMLSLKGMWSRLNREKDGNELWAPKRILETQLAILKGSAIAILNYLKPQQFGRNSFGASA